MTQNKFCPARLFHKLHIPDNCNKELAPIVLLHGLLSTHQTWTKLAPLLAERTKRSVIMVDLRNHGESEWSKDHSLNLMVKDVEHLLKNLEFSKYIIIGHSVGGRLACGVALNMPDKVELLIVEEATLIKSVENENDYRKLLKSLFKMIHFVPIGYTTNQFQKMIGKYLKQLMPEIPIEESNVMVPVHKDADGKFQFGFNADAIEEYIDDESQYMLDLENCKRYNGPALFLHGDKSPAPVFQDESIKIYMPNADFADVPNNNHTPHLESPDNFLKLVCDFISRKSDNQHVVKEPEIEL